MTQLLHTIHSDHRNYSILLSMLNSEIDQLESGAATDFIRLYDIMNYMTSYPDVFHHPAEEILFEHLVHKLPKTQDEISLVVNEHNKLAELGQTLKEKLNHVTSGAIVPKDKIISAAKEYYALLTNHINLEEGKLLPLVENDFSDEDWSIVNSEINAVEDPLFGNKVEEQFSNLFKLIAINRDSR